MAHLPAAEPSRAVDGWTRSWRSSPASTPLPLPSWRFSSSGAVAAAAAPRSAALHFWEGFRLAGELCGPNLAGLVFRQEARAASGWFESRGAQIGWVRGQARFSR